MLKRRILSVLLVLAMLVPFAGAAQTAQDNMRGVWVASVANIDYPSSAGMTAQALAAEADTMLDNIAAMGLNTVFLQVRPSADALYRSALFPQSRYVSGNCGASPDGDFDVLAYWVEGAHERGLQLHAWINPYRITRNGREELDALPESSPARQHPEWVVEYDGNYYFNPGLPAVQQLVVDGAAEIVRNYDVDGIHLDDYFYPGTDFNDAETFARYGADFSSIDDWRRDNVNTLDRFARRDAAYARPRAVLRRQPGRYLGEQVRELPRQRHPRPVLLQRAVLRLARMDPPRHSRLHLSAALLGDRLQGRRLRNARALVAEGGLDERRCALYRSRRVPLG